MIVDCHTHVWAAAAQLGPEAGQFFRRQCGRAEISGGPADHALAAECVDRSLVLAFCSDRLGADVPNDFVAEYVARHAGKMIGVGAVDLADARAAAAAERLLDRREFRALTVSPAAQGVHPCDSRAMDVYAAAARRGAPVLFCRWGHVPRGGRMEYARPALLDEVAAELPELVMVVSSLGEPWVAECLALLGKNPRVYADVAGLSRRPWQAYNALVLAHQYNVMDKLLFGSDWPFSTPAEAIQALYRLHEVSQGTNLPAVPREALRGIVERDALSLLGIARPGDAAAEAARPG